MRQIGDAGQSLPERTAGEGEDGEPFYGDADYPSPGSPSDFDPYGTEGNGGFGLGLSALDMWLWFLLLALAPLPLFLLARRRRRKQQEEQRY